MAISMASLRRSGENKPPIILNYATHGIGKTSFGAYAPDVVFLQTEDGLAQIEVATFGILTTYQQVMEAIGTLYSEPHEFKTVVLDSAGHLEFLIWQETAAQNNWPNIEHPGYGRGYKAATDAWRNILAGLKALRDERGMAVVILSHATTEKIKNPDVEATYDQFQPKLQEIARGLVQEICDCVLFTNYRISILKDNPKDASSRARGVGGGARVMYTAEKPSHLAKNRWKMPEQISLPDKPEMMWPAVAQHIPYYNKAANAVTEVKEQSNG